MKAKAGMILLGQGEGIMKTKARIILLGLVMAIALCYVTSARAESNFATGVAAQPAGAGASVNLDFRIEIPRFIYFRVGDAGAGINEVVFEPTAEEIAEGTTGINATGGSGNVEVRLVSNAGNISISEATSGATGLVSGSNTISYDQINTATIGSPPPAPMLSNAGTNSVNITAASGITNLSGQWLYTYDADTVDPPAHGTYTGQVTYTAVAIP